MTALRLCAVAAGCLAASVLALAHQSQTPAPAPQAPPSPPTFRVGIDAIPLDVLVLDKDRRPVRGLKQSDFTILENGKPQPIVSFGEVTVADPVAASAPWMREVASDVVSNEMHSRRLVLIVMDNASTGVNNGEPRSARKIAHAVIDQLGPDDLAAVVYTYLGAPQNFTTDRTKLRAAIETFQPANLNLGGRGPGVPLACAMRTGGCAVDALKHIGDFLQTAPPGRKTLIYVSPGVAFNFSPFNPALSDQIFALQDMFQALELANVSVYAIDPVGLTIAVRDPDVLDFAENTGGRSIRNDNEAWLQVPDVFRENSTYYLLGYQSTNPVPDGGFRHIEVKVNHPGVDVRNRSGYYARKPEKAKPSKQPLSAIDQAISRGLPGGDIPLRVGAAAFAVPGRRDTDVAIVVGLRDLMNATAASSAAAGKRIDLIATAFDSNWAAKGAFRQTIELTPRPGGTIESRYEALARLPLRPGRYEVRVAAEADGRTGSAFLDIDVPDFSKADLSVSGLMLAQTPPSMMASANVLEGLIPIVPTTVRDFAPTDHVSVFGRIYQGGKHELIAPAIALRIVDDENKTVWTEATPLSVEAFSPQRSADYRVDLPLSKLRTGEHLLTMEVGSGKKVVRRTVRFHVK